MSGSGRQPRVVVLGSINMDLVARCATLPQPGETLTATSFEEIAGGKGANQAVASSRAGGHVAMIGRVGDDAFASRLLTGLQEDQIDVGAIQQSAGPSGVALITVADDGENQIVVVPGANGCLTPGDVDQFAQVIADADVLLMQLEVPLDSVLRAMQIAQEADTRVILDPAPVPAEWPNELFGVDLICPNQTEAAALTGEPASSLEEVERAARVLHDRGAKSVVVTLGGDGVLLFDGDGCSQIESLPTTPVDATAAGDAFVGALAVRWSETDSLIDAVRFGNAAGSVAVSRAGARPSLPTRTEIEEKLKHAERGDA